MRYIVEYFKTTIKTLTYLVKLSSLVKMSSIKT